MIGYYLVLDEYCARQRRATIREEMKKLKTPVKEFIGDRWYTNAAGCSRSHRKMMIEAQKAKTDLLVFEDDAKILDGALVDKQIQDALEDDFVDVCYLGCHPPQGSILSDTDKWYRIKGVTGTHAILYKRKAIKYLLSILQIDGSAQDHNIDNTVRDNLHSIMNCVIPKNMVVSMYAGYSIRSGREMWQDVDEKMETRMQIMRSKYESGNN